MEAENFEGLSEWPDVLVGEVVAAIFADGISDELEVVVEFFGRIVTGVSLGLSVEAGGDQASEVAPWFFVIALMEVVGGGFVAEHEGEFIDAGFDGFGDLIEVA